MFIRPPADLPYPVRPIGFLAGARLMQASSPLAHRSGHASAASTSALSTGRLGALLPCLAILACSPGVRSDAPVREFAVSDQHPAAAEAPAPLATLPAPQVSGTS
jgi:hypothetical protein